MGGSRRTSKKVRRTEPLPVPPPMCSPLFSDEHTFVCYGNPQRVIGSLCALATEKSVRMLCLLASGEFRAEFMMRLGICKNDVIGLRELAALSPSEVLCIPTNSAGEECDGASVFVVEEKQMANSSLEYALRHVRGTRGSVVHLMILAQGQPCPRLPRRIKIALCHSNTLSYTARAGLAAIPGGPGACVASCFSQKDPVRTLVLCAWEAMAIDSVTRNTLSSGATRLADAFSERDPSILFYVTTLDDDTYVLSEAGGGWVAFPAAGHDRQQSVYVERVIVIGDGTPQFWALATRRAPLSSTVFFVPEPSWSRLNIMLVAGFNTLQRVVLDVKTPFVANAAFLAVAQAVQSFNKIESTADLVNWWGIGIACISWPGSTVAQVAEMLKEYLPAMVGVYKIVVSAGFKADGASSARKITVSVLDHKFKMEHVADTRNSPKLYHCFCVISPDKNAGQDIPALWRITYTQDDRAIVWPRQPAQVAQEIMRDVKRVATCFLALSWIQKAGRLRIIVEGFVADGATMWHSALSKAAAFLVDTRLGALQSGRRGCGLVARLVTATVAALVIRRGGPESRVTNTIALASSLQGRAALPPTDFAMADVVARHVDILAQCAPACYKLLTDDPPPKFSEHTHFLWDSIKPELAWLAEPSSQ